MSSTQTTKRQDLDPDMPDLEAQKLWQAVADALDRANDTLTNIYCVTVGGSESRAELTQALALLEQVLPVLKRVEAREEPRYLKLAARFDKLAARSA